MKTRTTLAAVCLLVGLAACTDHAFTAGSQQPDVQEVVYLFTDRTCVQGPITTRIRFESEAAKEVYLTRREFKFERGEYNL